MNELFSGLPEPIGYGLAVVLFGGWVGLLWMVRLLFTGRLCSGRELAAAERRCDKWEGIALRALGVADKTAGAAEALHDVAAALPDPAKKKEGT